MELGSGWKWRVVCQVKSNIAAMSNVTKVVKGKTSVLERTKQFESISKPSQPGDQHTDESDEEDDGLDFAELVRNITSENQATSGVSESDALKEAFKILDYDEDGFISLSDLRTALNLFENDDKADEEGEEKNKPDDETQLHNDDEETDENTLHEMIAEADFDGDGQISFDDFLKVLVKPDEPEDVEVAKEEDTKKKKHKKKHRKHAK